jgi:hypothetical protein
MTAMKNIVCAASIIVLCVGCASEDPYIPDRLDKEKLSMKNRAIVEKQTKAIQAELATLKNHPWAGAYYMEYPPGCHGMIYGFAIAPKAGYTYFCESDDAMVRYGNTWQGYRHDQNYGSVTWEDGRIKLLPTLENEGYVHECATEFVPVPWGNRLYLVPADKMLDFCNSFKERQIFCFVRADSRIKPKMWREDYVGKPDVPDEFKPYLLDEPVSGEIIAVGETTDCTKEYNKTIDKGWATVVTINKGSQEGLLPGMKMKVTNPMNGRRVKLTTISEMESEGIIERYHGDQEEPQVGWSVSTCP